MVTGHHKAGGPSKVSTLDEKKQNSASASYCPVRLLPHATTLLHQALLQVQMLETMTTSFSLESFRERKESIKMAQG